MTRLLHGSVLALATLVTSARVIAQRQRATLGMIARAVDSLAVRIVSAGLTPGLGVALVMHGRTIHVKLYGMADVTGGVASDGRTLWYIASMSKSLTGFGVSLLAHQRVIDLRAPISQLLPKAPMARRRGTGNAHARTISVAHTPPRRRGDSDERRLHRGGAGSALA